MHFNFIFHLAHLKLYANIPTKTSIHIHICICALIGAPFRTSNHSMWSRSSCATNKSFKFYDKTMRNDLKCRQVKKPHKTCWSTAAKYTHTTICLPCFSRNRSVNNNHTPKCTCILYVQYFMRFHQLQNLNYPLAIHRRAVFTNEQQKRANCDKIHRNYYAKI